MRSYCRLRATLREEKTNASNRAGYRIHAESVTSRGHHFWGKTTTMRVPNGGELVEVPRTQT